MITKLDWFVKIRSMCKEKFDWIWVGSDKVCLNSQGVVIKLILVPSVVVISFPQHLVALALKSLVMRTKKFLAIISKSIKKFVQSQLTL